MKLTKDDFKTIKNVLENYCESLENKLCAIAMQKLDCSCENFKIIENSYLKVEEKWSEVLNLLRKLY